MKTMEWFTVDKSAWGDGPWQSEVDKKQWRDKATGLMCLIHRGPSGALCGYVGIPEAHPLYGKDYEVPDVVVHGGLTYADKCMQTDDPAKGICHIPDDGEHVDLWWFGFDCAHFGDVCPAYKQFNNMSHEGEAYKTIAYVQRQVTDLAKQFNNMQ